MKEKKCRREYMKAYYQKHREEIARRRRVVHVNKLNNLNIDKDKE